ncbi:MAG TPA: PAS domain S-box protein [Chitinophagaceae bacterium]|jgi:PAS domain S-box-containing protein|nr:PAS domain S-box protein [Chitinophagaceae bacterium]
MTTISSLHRIAFNKSSQASIIATGATGRIISGNKAACQLLGYTSGALLTKKWTALFKTRESSFRKMIRQREVTGHGSGLVCVNLKNGKIICCEITSAFFTDGEGIERTITTITDRSGNIRLQKKIDKKNKEVVAENISIAKTKQKKIDTKKNKIVARNIVLAQKTVAENIGLAKSRQKKIDKRKNKTVADNIVLAQSRQRNIDTKNKKTVAADIKVAQAKSDKRFQLIFNSSSDVLYDIDLVKNEILLSDAYEKEFGYSLKANMSPVADWADHIHPEDKEGVIKDYTVMLDTSKTEWKYSYRFLKADRSVATVMSSAIILRTLEGKAYRMIGSMQDISKQTVLEARLKSEVLSKERQIAAAMKEAKETERSDIGRELHDNVNQLLGVSRLYLDMAKRGGADSSMYLGRSSEYTLTAIEEIRKLTKGLTTNTIKYLGLCEAINDIAEETMKINPVKISCSLKEFSENSIDEKFKVNIFRIIQEQLNNILKHAKATRITINLFQDKKVTTLVLNDNGVGFDTTRKQKGIGVENIKSRAGNFRGNAEFVSSPGNGCTLTVVFPMVRVAERVQGIDLRNPDSITGAAML